MLYETRFVGCPQTDEHGRAVFEAITSLDLGADAIFQLSEMWKDSLVDCDYPPLWSLFEFALGRVLATDDSAAALSFVRNLPPDPSDAMRATLWRFAESRVYGSNGTGQLTWAALKDTNGAERVARTIEAMRSRDVPPSAFRDPSLALLRDHPSIFIPSLVQASPQISYDVLANALSAVEESLARGVISPSVRGFGDLRGLIRSRGLSADWFPRLLAPA
jgi:hypothetical protein